MRHHGLKYDCRLFSVRVLWTYYLSSDKSFRVIITSIILKFYRYLSSFLIFDGLSLFLRRLMNPLMNGFASILRKQPCIAHFDSCVFYPYWTCFPVPSDIFMMTTPAMNMSDGTGKQVQIIDI